MSRRRIAVVAAAVIALSAAWATGRGSVRPEGRYGSALVPPGGCLIIKQTEIMEHVYAHFVQFRDENQKPCQDVVDAWNADDVMSAQPWRRDGVRAHFSCRCSYNSELIARRAGE